MSGRKASWVASLVMLACAVGVAVSDTEVATGEGGVPPNVLILFVDDLGYGDLGCYGNTTIISPNIDKLAADGVRFAQWLSGDSICTPSRGALLTGRHPIRIGLADGAYHNRVLHPASPGGLLHSELTLAEALKERGYATHMTGKWHLGIGKDAAFLPPAHGFDQFYGVGVTNVQSCMPGKRIFSQATLAQFIFENTKMVWIGAVSAIVLATLGGLIGTRGILLSLLLMAGLFYLVHFFVGTFTLMNPGNCLLYMNTEIIQQPMVLYNMTQRFTANAQAFIKHAVKENKPWFLYMSYVKVHTALFTNEEFKGVGKTEYIDNVAELDWSVGQFVKTLDELGISENTLIFFTSDNGPFLERGIEGGSAGELRGHRIKGGKGQIWEGGHRVPGIVKYPAKVPAGQVTEEAVSTMDIYPTTISFVDQALGPKVDALVISEPFGIIDGRDITKLLMDPVHEKSPHKELIHYCGDVLSAVRIDSRYKAIFYTPIWEGELDHCPTQTMCGCTGSSVVAHDPPLLFDLYEDPGERTPLTKEGFDRYDEIIDRVRKAIAEHEATIAEHPHQPSQLKQLQLPWLLPCCDYPKCQCDKERLGDADTMFHG